MLVHSNSHTEHLPGSRGDEDTASVSKELAEQWWGEHLVEGSTYQVEDTGPCLLLKWLGISPRIPCPREGLLVHKFRCNKGRHDDHLQNPPEAGQAKPTSLSSCGLLLSQVEQCTLFLLKSI